MWLVGCEGRKANPGTQLNTLHPPPPLCASLQVGLAGPSGSGKTAFSEKIKSFIPGCALLSMDHYNDGSKVIDGNFDGGRGGVESGEGRAKRWRCSCYCYPLSNALIANACHKPTLPLTHTHPCCRPPHHRLRHPAG